MLFHPDLIDHRSYSLISQNKDKIISQSRFDDRSDTCEVREAAIDGNIAFYSFAIVLISQNITNFKAEENPDGLPGKTIYKGEILPEQAEKLFHQLQSEYGTVSEDEIPFLLLYIDHFKGISSGDQPLPAVVTIDNEMSQITKVEVDTTSALKKAELESNFLETNEENMKNTILLDSALTQEFSDYNLVKSIQIP